MKTYKKEINTYTIQKNKTNIKAVKISSSADSFEYIKDNLYDSSIDIYESFFILLLNKSNNVTGFVKISQGGISGTVVDVKLIAKYAISELASSVIIAHNHPSGNTKPSNADIEITKKIKEVMRLIDSHLLDHIILTSKDGYYSFADEGIL